MDKNDGLGPEGFALCEFADYREARLLATQIADREERHPDLVFSDAMHVTAATVLEASGLPNTRPNLAWIFDRIYPSEVLAILRLRFVRPDEYAELPMAHHTDNLSPRAMEAAEALANSLTQKELDAFFFSDRSGNA
jgi:broad specificity phosphatase PhoE